METQVRWLATKHMADRWENSVSAASDYSFGGILVDLFK